MRWLFADGSAEDLDYASYVLGLLEDGMNEAAAPSIWPLEVANVIARAEARALIGEAKTTEFTATLKAMAIEVDTQTALHAFDDILQLARRFNLSSYDAAYLELALRQGLPLATLDTDLRDALARTGVGVA